MRLATQATQRERIDSLTWEYKSGDLLAMHLLPGIVERPKCNLLGLIISTLWHYQTINVRNF